MTTMTLLLHGEKIGTLRAERSGKTILAFDQDWLERPDRPTLSLSMTPPGGKVTGERRLLNGGTKLPPYIENLLPENENRRSIGQMLGIKPSNGVAMLMKTGRNLFGAIEIAEAEQVELVVGQACKSGDLTPNAGIAGVQRKLSSVERATISRGDWIVKMGNPEYPLLVENEVTMMQLARAAGFPVPDVRIETVTTTPALAEQFGGREQIQAFAVRRFDRTSEGKIHAEEFAQALGFLPDDKYSAPHEVLVALARDTDGLDPYELIRRIALNIVVGNGDGHAKNFGIIFPDKRTPALAPVYDLVCTAHYNDQTLAMAIGGKRVWNDVRMEAFDILAQRLDLDQAKVQKAVNETINMVLGAWHEIKPTCHPELAQSLERFWDKTCGLVKEYVFEHGFPPPLPRVPDYPDQTHTLTQSPAGNRVLKKANGRVDNEEDAAVITRDGQEFHYRDGREVDPDLTLGRDPKP